MAAKPKIPPPQPTPTMPLPNDQRAKLEKRTAQNRLMQSRGREYTNLADDSSEDDLTTLGR